MRAKAERGSARPKRPVARLRTGALSYPRRGPTPESHRRPYKASEAPQAGWWRDGADAGLEKALNDRRTPFTTGASIAPALTKDSGWASPLTLAGEPPQGSRDHGWLPLPGASIAPALTHDLGWASPLMLRMSLPHGARKQNGATRAPCVDLLEVGLPCAVPTALRLGRFFLCVDMHISSFSFSFG